MSNSNLDSNSGHQLPFIERIETIDLQVDWRTKKLYVQAVQRGYLPNNEGAVLEFFCWAEKALADDDQGTAGKLFYHLLKTKNSEFVTNEHEERALLRVRSTERTRLVEQAEQYRERDERSIDQFATEETTNHFIGRNIGFLPAPMVQCFLPQQKLSNGSTTWDVFHGNSSLSIEAGRVAHTQHGQNIIKQCRVPFGYRPRLIFPYIVGYAVSRKTPKIDMGRSLRQFCEKMKVPVSGRNAKELTLAVEDIAAASIMIGFWGSSSTKTRYSRIAKEVSFWIERNDPEYGLWQPEMVLSDDFFHALTDHNVPIDMNHLIQLHKSPRRMDLYTWLSYRTKHTRMGQPVRIPYSTLHAIFAPNIADRHRFKQKLKKDLVAICQIHPFRVRMEASYLQINHTRPPITPHLKRLPK